MKRLAILTFTLGVIAAPLQAHAQKPVEFNGMVFDSPPTQGYGYEAPQAPTADRPARPGPGHQTHQHHHHHHAHTLVVTTTRRRRGSLAACDRALAALPPLYGDGSTASDG